jgi:hypothetical protein
MIFTADNATASISLREAYMPEVILCRYCKQSINKETDAYVVIRKAEDAHPEELAHVACEQKRPTGFGIEEWMRGFPWRSRS